MGSVGKDDRVTGSTTTLHTMVLFGFKTINSGEQALVRNHLGVAKLVEGPARVTLWRSTVEKLVANFAAEGEYLEINYKHGPRQCLAGPRLVFNNPVEMDSIHVRDSILVSANEALVVYSASGVENDETEGKLKPDKSNENRFERKVLYGPMRYVPKPREWIHEFRWHGEDPSNKTRKIQGALQFKLLRIIADQMYYNIQEVRTKDDTMITVKVMIFFQLVNIEKMLDNTADPIADFINACCSDIIQYLSSLSYEEFVENTQKLNDISTYKTLTSRAEMIGYNISKVVFRGFHSSDALQNMHDKAIHERTRLRLEADNEDHRQKTLDLQLAKEEERGMKQRELEREKEEHKRMMDREKHSECLRLKAEQEEHQQKLLDIKLARAAERGEKEREVERLREEHLRRIEREKFSDGHENQKLTVNLEMKKKEMSLDLDKQRISMEKERLDGMKGIGVDLTAVLVAECRNADKSIKISSGDQPATLHIHEGSD